MTESW